MKIFLPLILASATVSSVVGIVTEDIFNAITLYTPLSLISIVVKNSLDDRKIKKQLLEEK